MPERFSLPITPTIADIDELGHVSNLVYLRWVLEIATAHSRSVGWDHPEYRALGAVFVVRRHEIDYVAQVKEGDSLVGETWVEDWKQALYREAAHIVVGTGSLHADEAAGPCLRDDSLG